MKLFHSAVVSLAIATIAPFFSASKPINAFSLTNSKKPLRIMPLGDSNTRGKEPNVPTGKRAGYRDDLWALFQDRGFNVDFVGSLSEGPSTVKGVKKTYTFDDDHQGHGGYAIKGSGAKGEILPNVTNWLKKAMPDVVLLMGGTNDFLYQKTTAEKTRDELRELIDKILSWSSDVELFVASIPPIKPSRTFAKEASKYNDLIANLLNSSRYKNKKVHFVDNRKNLALSNLWSSSSDTVHLNNQGYQKLAQSWFNAIVGAAEPSTTTKRVASPMPQSVSNLAFAPSSVDTPELDFAFAVPENTLFNEEAEVATNPTSVPEPNSASGVLVLGAIGIILLWKRQKPQKAIVN